MDRWIDIYIYTYIHTCLMHAYIYIYVYALDMIDLTNAALLATKIMDTTSLVWILDDPGQKKKTKKNPKINPNPLGIGMILQISTYCPHRRCGEVQCQSCLGHGWGVDVPCSDLNGFKSSAKAVEKNLIIVILYMYRCYTSHDIKCIYTWCTCRRCMCAYIQATFDDIQFHFQTSLLPFDMFL